MNDLNPVEARGAWAIGGGTLLGLGAGFFFMHVSIFAFLGCLLGGIGLGLIVAAILSAVGR